MPETREEKVLEFSEERLRGEGVSDLTGVLKDESFFFLFFQRIFVFIKFYSPSLEIQM